MPVVPLFLISVVIRGYILKFEDLYLGTPDYREHAVLVFLGLVTSFNKIFSSSIPLPADYFSFLLFKRLS